jgi:hypothetical protein
VMRQETMLLETTGEGAIEKANFGALPSDSRDPSSPQDFSPRLTGSLPSDFPASTPSLSRLSSLEARERRSHSRLIIPQTSSSPYAGASGKLRPLKRSPSWRMLVEPESKPSNDILTRLSSPDARARRSRSLRTMSIASSSRADASDALPDADAPNNSQLDAFEREFHSWGMPRGDRQSTKWLLRQSTQSLLDKKK